MTNKESKQSAFPPYLVYSSIGFTIFDIAHILFGAYFLVMAFIEKGEVFAFDVAESSTEIVCSIVLLLFLVVIAKQNTNLDERRNYFTFAWLISTVSVFLPELFRIPLLISANETGIAYTLCIVEICLGLLAFLSFIIALIIPDFRRGWSASMLIGIISFFLLVPFALASTIPLITDKDILWAMILLQG